MSLISRGATLETTLDHAARADRVERERRAVVAREHGDAIAAACDELAARTRLPVASLIPMMLSKSASRTTVSVNMSHAVRVGTL